MRYNRDKKYTDEVYKRFDSGGTLWFFERTDTNEFQMLSLEMRTSNQPRLKDNWSKPIQIWHLHKAYLTKEDAQSEFTSYSYYEGGCNCCGAGSSQIPVEIKEQQFVDSKNK